MYPTQDTVTLLKFARLHEADVRASWPSSADRALRRRSPATPPRRPRRLRLPAMPTFHRPSPAA